MKDYFQIGYKDGLLKAGVESIPFNYKDASLWAKGYRYGDSQRLKEKLNDSQ